MYCHYRGCLDETRRQLYDWMYPQLAGGQRLLDTGAWPPQELNPVVHSILLDRPELCTFEGRWTYLEGMRPEYTLPPRAIERLVTWVDSLPLPGGAERPEAAYRYLLETVVYDLQAKHSQTAWGALSDRRAVCKGIAKAYQLLVQRQGIPCILVEGALDGTGRHVWNYVYLEGAWHHVDVTMGYPQFRQFVTGEGPMCGFRFTPSRHVIFQPNLLPKEAVNHGQ